MATPKKRPSPPAKKAKTSENPALRYMQTRLSVKGWTALKMLAAEKGKSLQFLVLQALNDLLEKNGKPRDVTGPDTDAK